MYQWNSLLFVYEYLFANITGVFEDWDFGTMGLVVCREVSVPGVEMGTGRELDGEFVRRGDSRCGCGG